MNLAARIIEKFGGITALARALGHENPTTVQGWKVRGVIPARQQRPVLEAAIRQGIDLRPEDFIMPSAPAGAVSPLMRAEEAEGHEGPQPFREGIQGCAAAGAAE